MDKEKDRKQQRPKEAEGGDNKLWESAFDSKATPTAQPPVSQLTANPAEGEHHAEEGGYEPESVVFDIGGFADPNHPAESNGKGIKVVMPCGLDSHAALVHAVMAMLRCTESEAQTTIQKEHIVWTNYQPEGHGTDREGNVVHLIRFKPKYVERTAHEPATLKPTEKDDLEQFKAFKLYLEDHEGDNVRDPYLQYDQWAKTPPNLFFVEDVKEPGRGMFGTDFGPARIDYEKKREAVVQYVVWERLRAKRESLAGEIADENGDMKGTVEELADSLPRIIDPTMMQQYLPDQYYSSWIALHARIIVAQGALEKGDATLIAQKDLGAAIFELGNWFAKNAEKEFLLKHFLFEEFVARKFSEEDVQEVHRLATTKDFGLEHGRQLLHLYYKLTFTLTELLGRIESEPTRMAMFLDPHADQGLDMHGFQIENQGKAGTAMLGMMHDHPNARKVNATFYPEAETKDFRQGGEKGRDDWSEGIALDLYLWHDTESGEWVLEDFSTVEEHKENRAKGSADSPVPAALFEELNSKLRFPKGALYYRCPDEASYRILRTTEPMTVADWLRTVAIAGLMIGLAVASGGTSIPAQVIMIGSAVAMAGAEVADMVEESQQGMLTTERVVVHSAMIASCILGSTTGALGMLEKVGKLGAMGGRVARVVAGLQVGADGVCVAVFTKEAFEGLKAAADDPEGVTFTRLLAFFLQMGMNGLMLYGMKGSMLEAAGAKKLTQAEELLKAETKEAMQAERMEARGQRIKDNKATFDAELEKLFGKERGRVVTSSLASTLGAMGGGISINISMTNFRKLCKIVKTLMGSGTALTVDMVIQRLEGLGMRSRELLAADRAAIQMAINDVKRENMTAAEIEFADSYYMHVADSDLTNYELRELQRRGYTINAETGSLVAPTGRTVDFKHEFLPNDLRSKSFDFNRYIDFEADGDLMALVEGRQRLRERIAQMRREIKERKANGEEIPKAEMDAFNKAASEVGVMSENIAERSLQKYLDGEGFIQVYPEIGAPSSKSGDFDRIYIKEGDGRYQIFEVKGGSSEIGDRIINDVAGIRPGSIAQQGTLPYLKQILHEMGKREATSTLAGKLAKALGEGDVEYMYFRQAFAENGSLKSPEIGQFDIREVEQF